MAAAGGERTAAGAAAVIKLVAGEGSSGRVDEGEGGGRVVFPWRDCVAVPATAGRR